MLEVCSSHGSCKDKHSRAEIDAKCEPECPSTTSRSSTVLPLIPLEGIPFCCYHRRINLLIFTKTTYVEVFLAPEHPSIRGLAFKQGISIFPYLQFPPPFPLSYIRLPNTNSVCCTDVFLILVTNLRISGWNFSWSLFITVSFGHRDHLGNGLSFPPVYWLQFSRRLCFSSLPRHFWLGISLLISSGKSLDFQPPFVG